jgi:hypothetical protein
VIRLLQLTRHRKARLWIGEPPSAEFSPTSYVRRVVSAGVAEAPAIRIAAVELLVPRGPVASYGLLGAELLDNGTGDGEVNVAVNSKGFPMQGSLAAMPDDVRIGLLDEYAEAVVSGVEAVVRDGWRFKGVLAFRWAAHAAVGSSPAIFADLGKLVARVFALRTEPSESDLVALFE